MNLLRVFVLVYTLLYVLYQVLIFIFYKRKSSNEKGSYQGGISILIPSYDEIYTIDKCLMDIVNSEIDFPIEIIVIDDGKGSSTLNCLKRRCTFCYAYDKKKLIDDKDVREVYGGYLKGVPIYVIDKNNCGKAKALNCALKICSYDYYLGIDADTFVCKDAIKVLHDSIGSNTLAIGGNIKPLDNNTNLIEHLLTAYQQFEYLRIFDYVRVSYNNADAIPLLSGAFSLYHKETVIKVGGYTSNTKGEDFDLSLKLQEYSKSYGGSIKYSKKACAYTEVPFDLKSLFRQRLRWNTGMIEVLLLHYKLLFELSPLPFVLWLMFIFEQMSLLVELLAFKDLSSLFILTSLEIIYTLVTYLTLSNNRKNVLVNLVIICIFGVVFHLINNITRALSCFKIYDHKWNSVQRKSATNPLHRLDCSIIVIIKHFWIIKMFQIFLQQIII